MSNTLLTTDKITNEALRILHNNLTFTKNINMQYDDSFARSGAKIGDTLRIRKPNQYSIRTGATLSVEDTVEESVNLQVSTQKGIDTTFTSADLTLDIDDFSDRILKPAMSRLASEIDSLVISAAADEIYNTVGTPGTDPAAALVWLQAGGKLDNYAAPRDDQRSIFMNPDAQVTTVDALKGLFQSSEKISEQYRKGKMGEALGFDFYMSQNVPRHTVGAHGGTPLVDGAAQTGSSLITDGWTASAAILKKGDILTLANVFGVNPETKQTLTSLQQFIVTADVSADGSGDATIAISPPITATTARQTVSAVAADNAAITVAGTLSTAYAKNIACHKDAITFATADLLLPRGVDMAARKVFDGISMRLVRQYDINTDKFPCRFDVMYGSKVIRPELACVVWGA